MTKKELEMIIKEKEVELKALKQQLKEMKEAEENKENEVLSYFEVIELEDCRSYLNSLDKKALNKIARQGGIKYNITVDNIAEIIESRKHKGDAWR